jgi:hypothetical protein
VKDPQRLNAEDLSWFVGFVEGDGSFSVNKNGKYVKYEFTIEVSIQEKSADGFTPSALFSYKGEGYAFTF